MPQTTVARKGTKIHLNSTFQPLRSVLQVPQELRNRQLWLMLLKVRVQDPSCIVLIYKL
jgi:hypothetical protein